MAEFLVRYRRAYVREKIYNNCYVLLYLICFKTIYPVGNSTLVCYPYPKLINSKQGRLRVFFNKICELAHYEYTYTWLWASAMVAC